MRVSVETANSVRVRVGACPAVFGRAPDDGEVLAWVVDLATPPVDPDELFRWLTSEEQVRAQRYRIAKAREQFVIGRGLLRGLLGAYLGTRPDAVELTYLPSRKPMLCDATCGLHFNVTHTDGIAVLAVARRRVGVDVEIVRPMRDADGLVGRYFSPAECAAYRALPEDAKQAGFFRGWTTKEAVIKAAGATVACLADFDVELNPSHPPGVLNARTELLAGDGWALAEWAAAGNVAVAVALEGSDTLVIENSI
ncbi:4'-phosphopantetheinyl transferase psf-1 [Gemmata obscuriglobus]|nr:4'-phosphopantetheinyl transferase superfamily protein [Gemmata obscuriglobus]QEG29148.1 4'-phosphopantetheinyl transferase psf-1 [Gemmata obscuriglobus]VTS07871.1 4 -phosphopantetheinyl transferase : Phosphopantetheinyl transferase OS=Oscillatoria acuminata PCC 6304 GN=Oscil6304_3459 PE=4 SV=1: ACPS [Gemmata obscuriglobus UQM 2246]